MERYFVIYELALVLKKMGFDEPCFAHYRDEDSLIMLSSGIAGVKYSWIEDDPVLAPLYDTVIDWFYEEHQINFNCYVMDNTWDCNIEDVSPEGWTRENGSHRGFPKLLARVEDFPEKKQALVSAITKALEILIKRRNDAKQVL